MKATNKATLTWPTAITRARISHGPKLAPTDPARKPTQWDLHFTFFVRHRLKAAVDMGCRRGLKEVGSAIGSAAEHPDGGVLTWADGRKA